MLFSSRAVAEGHKTNTWHVWSWNRSHAIKKYSSGAGVGAMLTKSDNSWAGAISFWQELRSPEFSNKRTILSQTSWEVWQQFINFLSVTHQRPGTVNLINRKSVLPQDQNSRSEVSGILHNYVYKWMWFLRCFNIIEIDHHVMIFQSQMHVFLTHVKTEQLVIVF